MGFSSSKSKSNSQQQSTSDSKNQAFQQIQQTYTPTTALTGSATTAIGNLLGLNGPQASDEGFQKFRDSSGYNFIKDEGIRGITGSKAAGGLLNSGSTLRAITGYGSNLADNFLNQYLASLTGLSNTGLQAGQLIAGAGNTAQSQSTGTSTGTGSSTGFQFK